MKLGTILACVLCFACGGAAVMTITSVSASNAWIGKNIPPDALKACQAIVNMAVDLGTDPTNQDLNGGLAQLDLGTASVLKFDVSSVPADLCLAGGKCGTVGAVTCAKKNLGLDESKIKGGICLVKCTDMTLPEAGREPQYWFGLACP